MKLLDTIYEKDFHEVPEVDRSGYYHRTAARAVLLDDAGKVFMMHVGLHGYHKLPGGGIDKGEGIRAALARELMEEVGCKGEVICELGETVEYRDFERLKQTSYCYLARMVGEKAENQLEQDELEEQMTEVMADSLDDAIGLAESDVPTNIEGKFIQRRDTAFLREAKIVTSQ